MNILLIFRLITKKIEFCKMRAPMSRYIDLDNDSIFYGFFKVMNVIDIDTLGNCYSNCFVLFCVLRE